MRIIINWIVSAAAIALTAYFLPGVAVTGIAAAFIAAFVIGFLNALIRPILLIITLPINILTLGLFTFVVNALLILLAAQIVPGFAVSGFWTAIFFSIILTIVHGIFHALSGDKK